MEEENVNNELGADDYYCEEEVVLEVVNPDLVGLGNLRFLRKEDDEEEHQRDQEHRDRLPSVRVHRTKQGFRPLSLLHFPLVLLSPQFLCLITHHVLLLVAELVHTHELHLASKHAGENTF